MTQGEAVTAHLNTWVEELGEDAAEGILFGVLLARADPAVGYKTPKRFLEELAFARPL